MKKITLTKGFESTVDDEDFEWLSRFRWQANLGYKPRAVRNSQGKNGAKMIYMHREIMRAREHEVVDHINGDPLDNRKGNLRLCTTHQNSFNQQLRKQNKSGYKGVFHRPDNPKKPWSVRIGFNGVGRYVGYFATKEEAALAYNEAAKKYHGDFARLNEV